MIALVLAGCHARSEGQRTDTVAAATPSTSARAMAIDASATDSVRTIAPPADASMGSAFTDAGDLDLLMPPYADEIRRCAAEIIGPRLGYQGSFLIHVAIDTADAGSPAVTISGAGVITHAARPGTCFDRLAQRIAADPRGRDRRFRIDVKGPLPQWVITLR